MIKILDLEPIKFGADIKEVKKVLSEFGVKTEEIINVNESGVIDALELNQFDHLFFDKTGKLAGYEVCADGTCREKLSIQLVKPNISTDLTLGKFCNKYCSSWANIDDYVDEHDEYEGIVAGYMHYGKVEYDGIQYVTQCTETGNYEETVLVIREDLYKDLPITISDDVVELNLTETFVKFNDKVA